MLAQNLEDCVGDSVSCINYTSGIIYEAVRECSWVLLILGSPELTELCVWVKIAQEGEIPNSVRLPGSQFCEHVDCWVTPQFAALMYEVWSYLGLAPDLEMNVRYSELGTGSDIRLYSAENNDKGFVLHLGAAEEYLRYSMNKFSMSRPVLNALHNREPDNPFFHYLWTRPSFAGEVTDETNVVKNTLNQCQYAKYLNHLDEVYPQKIYFHHEIEHDSHDYINLGDQWGWERDGDKREWEDSMGWDCIFMANLLEIPIIAPQN